MRQLWAHEAARPGDISWFDETPTQALTYHLFFADPVAAFTNIARSLLPGAPLTLLVWQSPSAYDWFHDITHVLATQQRAP